MKIFRSLEPTENRQPPGAAIRLESPESKATGTAWGTVLVVFMRALAGLWMFFGLAQWALVLLPGQPLFDTVSGARSAAVIFFAIADLVAAVGLWLATPWGGALWLFAATAQIFVAVAIKSSVSMLWIGLDLILIGVYFVLTFKAGEAQEP